MVVDFEIIGASPQNTNTEEDNEDFVIIQPVHNGKFSIWTIRKFVVFALFLPDQRYLTSSPFPFPECFEELEAGTGELAIDSYYYDSDQNRCLFFWYAGSGGNGNR